MSEQIDWSKAPEGATHYVVGSVSPFEMRDGDDWFFWSARSRKWVKLHGVFGNERFKEQALEIIQRPTTPSWSGEGRPPVGVVCELRCLPVGGWGKAEIKYMSETQCVWLWLREDCGYQVELAEVPDETRMAFRPIRTHEQIAADEREAAIKEIQREIMPAHEYVAEIILDAITRIGYRKP